jgi:hypothetical protein
MKGVIENMEPTTSKRTGTRRLRNHRYTSGERPNYLVELVAFGIVAITAILALAHAMATLR